MSGAVTPDGGAAAAVDAEDELQDDLQDALEIAEVAAETGSGAVTGGGVPRHPGQLRGPLRPAAEPHQPPPARRHRGRAVAGDRRVPELPRGHGDLGPGQGDRVPRRRGDPARPQDRPAAARGRGRGRGGPRAARGARPAVRAAAAVPGLQAGRRLPGRARADPGAAARAGRRARTALRRADARRVPRREPAAVRGGGGRGAGAEAGAGGHDRPRARAAGQRLASTWACCATGCGGRGRPPSARWWPTAS